MTETYYRTGKGDHRHADYHCADAKRSIMTGYPVRVPAGEIVNWPPCADCCTAEEIEAAARTAPATKVMCANTGVINPRRIYSTCRDCGKPGKVNGSSGKIRAHEVQK